MVLSSREVFLGFLMAFKSKYSVFFRDDAILPSSGFLLSISQELAGLGGDVLFFKNILVTAFFFLYR
jgi:outer membrane protein assembly factor BamA